MVVWIWGGQRSAFKKLIAFLEKKNPICPIIEKVSVEAETEGFGQLLFLPLFGLTSFCLLLTFRNDILK